MGKTTQYLTRHLRPPQPSNQPVPRPGRGASAPGPTPVSGPAPPPAAGPDADPVFFRGEEFSTMAKWTAVVLAVCLLIAALVVTIRSMGDRTSLYKSAIWRPIISRKQANQAFYVVKILNKNTENFYYAIKERPNKLEALVGSKRAAQVRTHKRRFNETLKKKINIQLKKKSRIQGGQDNIFVLRVSSKGEFYLAIKDLSPWNRGHLLEKSYDTYDMMGNIHLSQGQDKIFSLTGTHLSLFLTRSDKDSDKQVVNISDSNRVSAGTVILSDLNNQKIAEAYVHDTEDRIVISARGQGLVSLENNQPESQVVVSDGQVVDIDNLFMEARIEEAPVIAESVLDGRKQVRRYPFGDMVHIAGPVSLDMSFQSLGIEYMFREYLTGVPEENIPAGELWLTISHELQTKLAKEIEGLADSSRAPANNPRVSALIMNADTGAILAMAGDPKYKYNPADTNSLISMIRKKEAWKYNHPCFQRHNIGSVTKPFFALPGLSIIQGLGNLKIKGSWRTWTLFGHEMYSEESRKQKIKNNKSSELFFSEDGKIDFNEYLIHSNNVFNHSMGLMLMAGVEDLAEIPDEWWQTDKTGETFLMPGPGQKSDKTLFLKTLGCEPRSKKDCLIVSRSGKFAAKLREMFDIETSAMDAIVDDRDISIYGDQFIQEAKKIIQKINPDAEADNILKRRSTVCAPEVSRTSIESVDTTYAASSLMFGGKDNMWTDVKLCEAFSRIITGKKVSARIIQQFTETSSKPSPGRKVSFDSVQVPSFDPSEVAPEHLTRMRDLLSKVPIKGTAKKLKKTVEKLQSAEPMFRLFGKTGTINEYANLPSSKLFIGCFGLWNGDNPVGQQYSFVVYLKAPKNSNDVLNFVNENLKDWWKIIEHF